MKNNEKKPELLSPAGSPEALEAAIMAGADAIYFGGRSFNARKNASNFTDEELESAIRKCRLFGVKTNIVLNTQLYSNELSPALSFAEKLLSYGADAFIVADLGLAAAMAKYFPGVNLHASTQAVGQNILSAKELAALGFSRMVAPRELPLRDLQKLCAESPIETEAFIHGALCVSHSGQCLMSSVIGGRSGNRGECAQPCRLPYKAKNPYALSLKDLCLAEYVPELIDAGIASFKIEGRMKTPDYVYGVISVYRKLIDEHRGATPEEMKHLSELFSRSGFTDGYFKENITVQMLGIRTDEDKRTTKIAEPAKKQPRKIPMSLRAEFLSDKPASLTGTVERDGEEISLTVTGDVPTPAEKTPTSRERIAENLSKLGATSFAASGVEVMADEVNVPISSINAMRRALAEAMEKKLVGEAPSYPRFSGKHPLPSGFVKCEERQAHFLFFDSVTEKAKRYFDRIFLPLGEYLKYAERIGGDERFGIVLPPVAFDHEVDEVREMAKKAVAAGCQKALVSGLWQAHLADELGLEKHGDLRLNIFNSESAAIYQKLGFRSIVLSPEIGVSVTSALSVGIPKGYVVYGRLPLMTMEKCAIRDNYTQIRNSAVCRYCDTHRFSTLKDRTGAEFLLAREFKHRNVLYNSVPVYMADRPIAGMISHAIFTDEGPRAVDAVIEGLEKRLPAKTKFKRL